MPQAEACAATKHRCPKCGAKIRKCGFSAHALVAFMPFLAGFVKASTAVTSEAHCMLCDAKLPWTVEELRGV